MFDFEKFTTTQQPKDIDMFNAFSPLEHLKALGIAYAVGVTSTLLVSLYLKWNE